jgi:hypothetical protein
MFITRKRAHNPSRSKSTLIQRINQPGNTVSLTLEGPRAPHERMKARVDIASVAPNTETVDLSSSVGMTPIAGARSFGPWPAQLIEVGAV